MDTKKTTRKKEKTASTDFGFKPEDFKGMFEMMGNCCKAQNRFPDCNAMMKTMMQKCCGPQTEDTKSETQKK